MSNHAMRPAAASRCPRVGRCNFGRMRVRPFDLISVQRPPWACQFRPKFKMQCSLPGGRCGPGPTVVRAMGASGPAAAAACQDQCQSLLRPG
jgi:hypothetical protein